MIKDAKYGPMEAVNSLSFDRRTTSGGRRLKPYYGQTILILTPSNLGLCFFVNKVKKTHFWDWILLKIHTFVFGDLFL